MRRTPLISGLALSLIVHGFVLGPAMSVLSREARRSDLVAHARFDPDQVRDPARPMEEQIVPGIDAPTPSSMTWVGYEDYEEHIARLAETDQAAFAEAAAAAPTEPVDEQPRPPQPPEAAEIVEPAEAEEEESGEDEPPTGIAEEEPEPEAVATVAETAGGNEAAAPDSGAAFTQWLVQIAESARRLAEQSEATGATEVAEAREAAEPQPAAPSPEKPEVGDPSDRQSDPTSTIEIPFDRIKLGRPVARPGIEIRPRRPELTDLTRLTSGAGNPLVEIRFDRTGRPRAASILSGSGDLRIDEAVLSSLYRWRASGERLAVLAGEETLALRVRIVWRAR